jgi:predicted AAA+ superfamily ATPase
MQRTRLSELNQWLKDEHRKPLVLRGARQVGKTWLARVLAKTNGLNLIELNFEKHPKHADLFASNKPETILLNLNTEFGLSINPSKSLLLLDEIQGAPELLAKLRWFAEDMPNLPVIATGSLLEFVLEEHDFSMPVGRINYMHLEPMSFEEFLMAQDKESLLTFLNGYQWGSDIPISIHEQFSALFKEYVVVGGLPAAVQSWTKERSLISANKIHNDLFATYRDDFSKYSKRVPTQRLDEVMSSIPKQLASKFIYSSVNPDASLHSIKQALYLLNKARVSHCVMGSSANGIPLGADVREKYFKEIFIDVGLSSAALGLSLKDIPSIEDLSLLQKGALAEQVVGQLLRTLPPFYIEPKLYCWAREEKGSSSEVDYLIQHDSRVVPVEVKAGKTGTLKSLHVLMGLKNLSVAVRINADFPSITDVKVINSLNNEVNYKLLSLPFYLLGQLHRLIESEI